MSVAPHTIEHMSDTLAAPDGTEVDTDLDPFVLLASLPSERAAEDAAAARQLGLAARWADLHPPESIHQAASFTAPGSEHEEPIAGQGCPLVAEFCVPELGAVLGITSTSAKKLIGQALELRHRLPRLWALVHAGRVPAWRARLVAETTIHSTPSLTVEAVGWVDDQVAAVAGKVGVAQLDRLVAEAIRRHDLVIDPRPDDEAGEDHEDYAADQYLRTDPHHVTVDRRHVHYDGLMRLEAELDLADALDLDAAVAHGAAVLKTLGSTAPLGARRATALGDLARTQTALDLHIQNPGASGSAAPAQRTGDVLPPAREVVLHVHLDATTSDDQTVVGPTARLDNGQRLALLDQVEGWCAVSRTKVTIRPVIDLDIDHITPYDHHAAADGRPQPGSTATSNLAALCRFHHRLKTHTAWRYEQVRPGSSGPAPTATTTSATTTAPPPSTHPALDRRSARADHDPAPYPATHPVTGSHARPHSRDRAIRAIRAIRAVGPPCGRGSACPRPSDPQKPSLRSWRGSRCQSLAILTCRSR